MEELERINVQNDKIKIEESKNFFSLIEKD